MYKLWLIGVRFLVKTWKIIDLTRKVIVNIVLLLVIMVVLCCYIDNKFINPYKEKGALILDITGRIVDKPSIQNKFKQFSQELFGISKNKLQENSIFELVNIIRKAKNDKNITGIILSLKNLTNTDTTSLQYIGKVLIEFRNSGKPIFAISDHYSQTQYFLASYANKIYLTPEGSINLQGIATHNIYYKSLLDKLKINSHIFRVGKYKSAVEPFLRDNMSDHAKEKATYLINQIWQQYLITVSTNRKITTKQLFPGTKKIIEDLQSVNGNTAKYALKNKLIDKIASHETIENDMTKIFGWNNKTNSFNSISIYDYKPIKNKEKNDKIAVILVNGPIIDGPEINDINGSENIANKIRNARLNPNIKAIIFRINSPGGSLSAAELISEELLTTRKSGKPIIVTMGEIAASGGYWIATPANYIIAHPNTLTGSIGIFGVINTFENLLDSIGIHYDGVSTSSIANITVTQALPEEFKQIMQLNVKYGYKKFLSTVANTRNKNIDEIEKIAQGQVWTGIDALKHGLIDAIGDFDDALNKAVKLTNLKDYEIIWDTHETNILDLILKQINNVIYIIVKNIFINIAPKIGENKTSVLNPNQENNAQLHNNISTTFIWNDPKNCYAIHNTI